MPKWDVRYFGDIVQKYLLKKWTLEILHRGGSQTTWTTRGEGAKKAKNMSWFKAYKYVHQVGRGVKKGQKSVHLVCERPHIYLS